MFFKLKEKYDNIKTWLINAWKLRKALAKHHPYDYQGYLEISKAVLQDMYDYQSSVDYFVSVNRDNTCKRMKVVINSLDRLIEDNYNLQNCEIIDEFTENGFTYLSFIKQSNLPSVKSVSKHSVSKQKEDLFIVSKFIERYLLNCWH